MQIKTLKFWSPLYKNYLEKVWLSPTDSPFNNIVLPVLKLGKTEWHLRVNYFNLIAIAPSTRVPYPIIIEISSAIQSAKN